MHTCKRIICFFIEEGEPHAKQPVYVNVAVCLCERSFSDAHTNAKFVNDSFYSDPLKRIELLNVTRGADSHV